MIKNNIKALLIHIVISILSFIISMLFHTHAVKWVSEEAANQHHFSMLGASFLIIIVLLFLYSFSQYQLLKTFQSSVHS